MHNRTSSIRLLSLPIFCMLAVSVACSGGTPSPNEAQISMALPTSEDVEEASSDVGGTESGSEETPETEVELEPEATSLPEPTATVEPTVTPEPTDTPAPTPEPTKEPSPTPDIQMYLDLELPEGDPTRGQLVAIRYSCRGCHYVEDYEDFSIGFGAIDGLPPIMERGEVRIADPDYTGKATSNLEYIVESIYLPEAHLVSGEWVEPMPVFYAYRLTDEQDLSDLLAWMTALNDPDFENK